MVERVVRNNQTLLRTYEYNSEDLVTESTDRDGRTVAYDYDALDRPLHQYWYDAQNSLVNTVTTTYDIFGRVTSFSDDHSLTGYAY